MSFESNVRETWPEKADEILAVIRGNKSPDDYASVKAWVKECYNPPNRHERVACALNEILEGYGIEAIRGQAEDDDDVIVEYVNMGDTYDTTLVYTGKWRVTTWGDTIEWLESKGIYFE